jgi:hypothetical protein
MENERSLRCSQEPSTGPHLQPDESSQLIPPNFISRTSIITLSTHLHLDLPSDLFGLTFPTASYIFSIRATFSACVIMPKPVLATMVLVSNIPSSEFGSVLLARKLSWRSAVAAAWAETRRASYVIQESPEDVCIHSASRFVAIITRSRVQHTPA